MTSAGALRLRWPGVPTVLVTRRSVENLVHLKDFLASEVVDIGAGWQHVGEIVATLDTRIDLTAVADIVRNASMLDPLLSTVLAAAFELQPRASTVSGLARHAGVPVSTLRRHYRSVDRRSGITLPDFLHAIRLADVTTARQTGAGLGAALKEAWIDRRTASKTVARISGGRLADVTAGAEHYRKWLVRHVIERICQREDA